MRKFLMMYLLLGWTVSLAACGTTQSAGQEEIFDGQRALSLVAEQISFGPRFPGSVAHGEVQDWIIDELGKQSWGVERQDFQYRQVDLLNIIGRNAEAGDPFFILGAHYDTRPIADQEPVDQPGPVPGANDGASGVAVLLEIARVIPPETMSCQVWLAFFDAEDSGGLDGWDWIVGSSFLAENLTTEPTGVVIVDMVGDRSLQLPRERNSTPSLQDELWETGRGLGYQAFQDRAGHSMLDDHTPFLRRGIPAVDIIDFDYAYWHTEADTLDKVSAQSLEAVGRTLERWLESQCQPTNSIE